MVKYSHDMPNVTTFDAEINLWENYRLNMFNGQLPNSLETTIENDMTSLYPNIYKVCLQPCP